MRAIPGVQSVALTRVALLSGSRSSSRYLPGQSKSHNLHVMNVSPEFFDTLGVRVMAGRGFTDRDTATSPKVAVINETAAQMLFPGESAAVRTASDPIPMTGAFREAIRRVESTLPVTGMSTQVERVEGRFAQERLFATAGRMRSGSGWRCSA